MSRSPRQTPLTFVQPQRPRPSRSRCPRHRRLNTPSYTPPPYTSLRWTLLRSNNSDTFVPTPLITTFCPCSGMTLDPPLHRLAVWKRMSIVASYFYSHPPKSYSSLSCTYLPALGPRRLLSDRIMSRNQDQFSTTNPNQLASWRGSERRTIEGDVGGSEAPAVVRPDAGIVEQAPKEHRLGCAVDDSSREESCNAASLVLCRLCLE